MANESNNPLSRLLDIDFPDFKRANWNNSFDTPTSSSVGFVKPIFVDRIMAGTRAQLDFDSASFANATVAPLYGRYKVKYLAFWAPDRLYMRDWLSGEKMEDDDYPYHFVNFDSKHIEDFNSHGQQNSLTNRQTGSGREYCAPTCLMEYLGYKPAYASAAYFSDNDNYPNQCAFPFLAFWDAYRTFFINNQEEYFPVRTRAFKPSLAITEDNETTEISAFPAIDSYISRKDLDDFFTSVKFGNPGMNITSLWYSTFGMSVYPIKDVIKTNLDTNPPSGINIPDDAMFMADEFHYLLPVATYAPDPFSSWISNENVQLEKSKSTVVGKVSVNSANEQVSTFTMEQWYLASRIQTKVRKNLYKFQDFATWIDTNFGVKPSTTLTQPMFLGAFSSDVVFVDAVNHSSNTSMVDTENGDKEVLLEDNGVLGARAGFGIGKNGNRANFFDFTAKEPGTVMILQYIVPEVHYFEFTDPMYEKLNFNEEFNPIFDALGFQDLQKGNVNAVPNLGIDPLGVSIRNMAQPVLPSYSTYNTALAQVPYGFEHMCKPNVLKGMMTMPSYYQNWTLARSFNYNRAFVRGKDNGYNGPLGLYSTYILPEMYTNIFANTQNLDNFQFYLSYNYKKYQPVSKQFLSFGY